ncbi:hypothetical protein C4588_06090 [Candidatus Parcubacteria bacterium]|nr:MAG: hypothetical protein C4588_06090 [Candidatus Parcubacteria bacterium]
MKVIGIIKPGEEYLCSVTNSELEKFRNLYYNKMPKLSVGQEFDLAIGYDFHNDVADMLKKTESFLSANKKMIKTITDGISFLGKE